MSANRTAKDVDFYEYFQATKPVKDGEALAGSEDDYTFEFLECDDKEFIEIPEDALITAAFWGDKKNLKHGKDVTGQVVDLLREKKYQKIFGNVEWFGDPWYGSTKSLIIRVAIPKPEPEEVAAPVVAAPVAAPVAAAPVAAPVVAAPVQGTAYVAAYPPQPPQQPAYPQAQPAYPRAQPAYPQAQPAYPRAQPAYPRAAPQPVYPRAQPAYPRAAPQPVYPRPGGPVYAQPQAYPRAAPVYGQPRPIYPRGAPVAAYPGQVQPGYAQPQAYPRPMGAQPMYPGVRPMGQPAYPTAGVQGRQIYGAAMGGGMMQPGMIVQQPVVLQQQEPSAVVDGVAYTMHMLKEEIQNLKRQKRRVGLGPRQKQRFRALKQAKKQLKNLEDDDDDW